MPEWDVMCILTPAYVASFWTNQDLTKSRGLPIFVPDENAANTRTELPADAGGEAIWASGGDFDGLRGAVGVH